MKALIIESSNFLFLVVGLFAMIHLCMWKFRSHTLANGSMIQAWGWIVLAVTTNVGWFAMSRHFAPNGHSHHPMMVEWRWLMVMSTALVFSWGMLHFIGLIEGFGLGKQILYLSIFSALSVLLGYL